MKKSLNLLLLTLILIIALATRWYKIDNPIADWHSFRQADTAAVGRYFMNHGFDLLHPRYEDLSDIQSGHFNPQGYRMVEFPLYNATHGFLAKTLPFWNVDKWGRALSVFISLGSIIFLYLIIASLSGVSLALIVAFLMAVLPFNIYYSRVILPEPAMLMLLLASTYFFLRFFQKEKPLDYLLSASLLALSLLVKPYAIFFVLPFLVLSFSKYRFKFLLSPYTYLFIFIAAAPLTAWRYWIRQFPEGIPVSEWLLNNNNIRFSFAWFRWLFGTRISRLMLGGWGLIPLGFGLLSRPKKSEHWVYHLWLFGTLLYFSVFAGGNVQHDYYQAIVAPFIIIPVAIGTLRLFTPQPRFIWPLAPLFVLFCLGIMLGRGWYDIREYYKINNPTIMDAGKRADELLPKDAIVVAPYGGDTAFLYQTNRQGFPAVTVNIDLLITHGATHYVSVNYDDITNAVINDKRFTILEKNPKFVIVKLSH